MYFNFGHYDFFILFVHSIMLYIFKHPILLLSLSNIQGIGIDNIFSYNFEMMMSTALFNWLLYLGNLLF